MSMSRVCAKAAAALVLLAELGPAPALAVSATACPGAAPGMPQLNVTGTGARRIAGHITFTLYGPEPARYLVRNGSLAVLRVPLSTRQATACFAVSEAGSYAVAIYHDENDNHHFDRNFLGLPVEGYGFSNDAAPMFAPPKFDAVKFTVHAGVNRIAIRLRY
nr:DUF2141 domain-containing protein [uncultured Lichenicoccus sp.]